MPVGRKRTTLNDRLEREVLPPFQGRVLPFDLDATRTYAELTAQAKASGRAIGKADGYIAATTAARGFRVAPRDASPFEATGLKIINLGKHPPSIITPRRCACRP